jgi:biopolymer transport protein ExbB/TolQ
MNGRELTLMERQTICPGEALALTAVMAVLAISIVAVVVYRLLKSTKGSAKAPGGWSFTWN